MLHIQPEALTERENYKLLIGSIIPRPIAFTTTISEDGVVNAAPFSFFNIVSSNPPMLSVSIQRKNGVMKDTARNAKANKQFVIHIVDTSNVEEINKTAANLPADESEIDTTSLTLVDSTVVNVPAVAESKVRFECELVQALELGDGDAVGCDLLIGRIVSYHIAEDIYEEGKIDPDKLAAVSRLAGNDYATIGEIFTIERPL